MSERPEQLPEGRLIAQAQKRARYSGRKAADLAGMSEGHWRAIVSGSRSISADTWVPVRAPAETLARMAEAVGVTPEQLTEAGRPDAADELRSLSPPAADPTDDLVKAALAGDPDFDRKMAEAIAALPKRDRKIVEEVLAEVDEMNRRHRDLLSKVVALVRPRGRRAGDDDGEDERDERTAG